jgi:hypothetical protein
MELKTISLAIVGINILILCAINVWVLWRLNPIRSSHDGNILCVQVLLILICRLNAFLFNILQLEVEEHQSLVVTASLVGVEHNNKWTLISHIDHGLEMNLVIVEHLFLL